MTYGFETLAQQAETKEKNDQIRQDKALALQHEALRQYEAARILEAAGNQRALSLILAGQDKSRQIELTREVNTESVLNLTRARMTLAEVSRASHPIADVAVEISLRSPAPTFSEEWTKEAKLKLSRQIPDPDPATVLVTVADGEMTGFRVGSKSYLLGNGGAKEPEADVVTDLRPQFAFVRSKKLGYVIDN